MTAKVAPRACVAVGCSPALGDVAAPMHSEQMYEALVETAPDALVVVSPSGEILLVNEQAVTLFGHRRDEMVGQPVEMLVPDALAGAHRVHRQRFAGDAARRHTRGNLEFAARRADGSAVAVEVSLSPLATRDGLCIAAHVRDISAQHPDTAALRLAQEQLRSAFSNAPIGMGLMAPDGRWMHVNDALCEIVGYTPDKLTRLRVHDVTHPDDLSTELGHLRAVIAGDTPGYRMAKRFVDVQGTVVWAQVTTTLVRGTDGTPLHLIAQVEDITRQRTTEEELRESQRRLRAMFDHIPAGLSLRDLDGRYLEVNAYTARTLSTTPERLVGKDSAEHLDDETRRAVRNDDVRVAETRQPLVSDVRLPHADGSEHDYHVVRYPVTDDEGRVTAFGAFSLDVTEQRDIERARAEALRELSDAQRLAAIGSWRWDPSTDRTTWSMEMHRMFGRDPDAGPATSEAFLAYVHPDDRDRVAQGYAQVFGGGPPFVMDYRIVRGGGERIIHALGRKDENHPGTFIGTVQDVTELREAERRRDVAVERFHSAFHNAPIGMAIADLRGRYQQVNHAFSELTGYSAAKLTTKTIEHITHPDDRARDWEMVRMLLEGEVASYNREKRYVRADGGTTWVSVHVTLLRDGDGEPVQMLIQVHDVSERRRHEDELRRLADHDALTGLLNRRGFERALAHQLAQAARYGDRGALLMLDLDHFKSLNDVSGHAAGDAVLKGFADLLRSRLRRSDVAARLGGDEFAVLLTEADRQDAESVAAALVTGLATHTSSLDIAGAAAVTLSAGCVLITRDSAGSGPILADADAALYEAKAQGRNQYVMGTLSLMTPARR